MGDAEIADALGVLPFAQDPQMSFPVDEIVNLHQVDTAGFQQPERILHLCDAGFAPARPNLGGDERLRMCVPF